MTTEISMMAKPREGYAYPTFSANIIILVGGFGSGKTEVAVNLTKYLSESGTGPITIVDLDLVNPYFRSREAKEEMEKLGISLIAPKGGFFFADLPILLPEIKGAIEKGEGRLILDVGGDEQGSRALGSLSRSFPIGNYEMIMILNSRRPFTSDVAGSLKTMARIEMASKLKFTGIASNSHMIDETTVDILEEGYKLAKGVAEATGLTLKFLSAKKEAIDKIDPLLFDCPILPLVRSMLKPWEKKADLGI